VLQKFRVNIWNGVVPVALLANLAMMDKTFHSQTTMI